MNRIVRICLLSFIISISFSSCESDSEVVPSQDERDKFLGAWSVDANGSVSGNLNYTIQITASSSEPSQILMKNFDFQGTGTQTIGEVAGNNIFINAQVINGDTIAGSGSYSNQKITFNYTVKDGITTDVVSAIATK